MKIKTRDFGELEINEDEVIHFRSPVYGFDDLERYVLLYDDSLPGLFSWLQSVERAEACFILVDPTVIIPDYQPEIPDYIYKLLGLKRDGNTVLRAVTVIPGDFSKSTMNLKSPIVINPKEKCAAQVILDTDYPLRALLMGGVIGRAHV